MAEATYLGLQKNGFEVLYDDRQDVTPGEKFAEADLLGMPYRVVVSGRNKGKLEVKLRTEKEAKLIAAAELLKNLGL